MSSFCKTRLLSLAVMALCAVGCQDPSMDVPVHPVTGVVHWRGKPASQVLVVFHPQGETSQADAAGSRSYAKSDAQGNYALTTRQPRDGAPLGKYTITLVWPPSEAEEKPGLHDKLGGAYADPRCSKLHYEVRAGENTVPTIELK